MCDEFQKRKQDVDRKEKEMMRKTEEHIAYLRECDSIMERYKAGKFDLKVALLMIFNLPKN